MNECRETLDQAIKIRTFYRDNIKLWTDNNPAKLAQVEAKMDLFERDLKEVLKVKPGPASQSKQRVIEYSLVPMHACSLPTASVVVLREERVNCVPRAVSKLAGQGGGMTIIEKMMQY